MYSPDKSAQEYFNEITSMVYDKVDTYFDSHFDINDISNSQDKIGLFLLHERLTVKYQVIFEIYYLIYLLCEQRHSLYYYYAKDNGSDTNCSEDFKYKIPLYNYHEYRKSQDDAAKYYYKIDYVGLHEELNRNNTHQGHKLKILDYIFVMRKVNNRNIGYLFQTLKNKNLPSSKKVSEADLFDHFFVGIEDLYADIAKIQYSKYSKRMDNYFLRSIDYYQFEKNCCIELSYNVAMAVSTRKMPLQEQKYDINIFRQLRITPLVSEKRDSIGYPFIQNKAVTVSKSIFDKYANEEITALELSQFYNGINNIIYACFRECVKEYFGVHLSRAYHIEIQHNPQNVKNEFGLDKLENFLCEETEQFFKSFFGEGQHITEKHWQDIKIKNFRDMYIEDL